MKTIKKVLVIGNNVRNIVCSARKAGYIVYAIDRFGDIDMQKCAGKVHILENIHENELEQLAGSFGDVDAVILGPGFEHLRLNNALNNSKEIMEAAGNKSKLPKKLHSLGIPHPETVSIDKTDDVGFPLMVKPKSGSGGMRNIIVRNEAELNIFKKRNDPNDFIAQEFIEGISCSASVISTGKEAVVVALNEQLIGIPWLTRLPFAYCGNITPFHTKFSEEMVQYAKQIVLEFKLRGSNGVDFILTDKGVQVIEVNPRFQGSIDTIELSTGLNIFDAHIKSFDGELPSPHEPKCFAAKTIVYANKEVVIEKDISDILINYMNKGQAADIPRSGVKVMQDEPITTIFATARTREMVLERVEKSARHIKGSTEV